MLALHSLRLPLCVLLAQLAACQMGGPVAERPDAGSDASHDVAEHPDADSDATPPDSPLGTRWVQPEARPGGRVQVLGGVRWGGSVIAMVTGERTLLRSDQFGQTWAPIPGAPRVPSNTPAGNGTAVMASEGNDVYIGSRAGGALVSHDGGHTFERFELGLPRGIATRLFLENGLLYALGVEDDPGNADPASAAYVSRDGGRTFSVLNPGAHPVGMFVTPRAILLTNPRGEVLISTDGGDRWTTVALPQFDVPTVFLGGSGDVLFASGEKLFRSGDGGFTWTWLADLSVESFSGFEGYAHAVSDGRVLHVRWDGVLTPVAELPRTGSMGIANAEGRLVAGTESEGIWRGVGNGGLPWVPSTPANCSFEHLTVFEGALAAMRDTSHAVFVSTDRATTWQPHSEGLQDVWAWLTVLTSGSSGLYAGTVGARVLRSTDGGATWQTIASRLNHDGSDLNGTDQGGQVLAIEEADGRIFVGLQAGTGYFMDSRGAWAQEPADGGVFVSTDGGASWRLSDTGLPVRTGMRTHPAGITALRSLGNHVLLAATQSDENDASSRASIYRSEDDGAHWTRSDVGFAPLSTNIVSRLVRDGSAVYAVTAHRVFRSDDGGLHWVRVSFGLPDDAVIWDLAAGEGFVAVATDAHGVYVSRDKGATGAALAAGLPTVPVLRLAAQGTALYASLRERGVWRLE